jgi:hypothetical protein
MIAQDGPISPHTGNALESQKPFEIPTRKPHIFLFLESMSIWWYVGHDCMGWSSPPLNRTCPNISKTVVIPILKPYIYIFVSCVKEHLMVFISHDITGWLHPPKTEKVPKYLKNNQDLTPKPFIMKVNPIPLSSMLYLGDFIIATILMTSCLSSIWKRC